MKVEGKEYVLHNIKASQYTVKIKLRNMLIQDFNKEIIESGYMQNEPMGRRCNLYFAKQIED